MMNKIKLDKICYQKVGFFRFRKFNKHEYLLTNDVGEYIILLEKEFKDFLEGKIKGKTSAYQTLQEQGLIRDEIDFSSLISKYRKKNLFLLQGPSLHIIVATLRCDHKCVYCQASSRLESEKGYDLDIVTAKKIVDSIFYSPSKSLAIEFQGGEPLLNWSVVKFIIDYSIEKNKTEKKDLELRLVSNFSLMNEDKLNFLVDNSVTLCTSLDGQEFLHNKNRLFLKGNSYRQTIKWLRKAQKIYQNKLDNKFRPGAIITVSRHSLKYPNEIVDEYFKQGIGAVFVRPVTPLGMAKKMWDKLSYSPEEYLRFYKKVLNRVISYALKHPKSHFHEYTAKIFLSKILTERDPNYLELRSPCGAGIGQLLYNYNGKVYTCDEGRMLGEDIFCIGDIQKDTYKKVISHPTVKVLSMASCLENSACDLCVYKPYCGTCPIYNWTEFGNLFSQLPNNPRCFINMGMLDFLFSKLQDRKTRILFRKWANLTLPQSN